MPDRRALPVADAPRAERADARANRQRILAAAATLFAGSSSPVTMDDIARAAGVGRATLYRRYPTVGAVAEALLDEQERELQGRILSGPPPLGPGGAPADRLQAFYRAMVALLETHAPLVLATEVGQARFETGAYGFWRLHVRRLLEEGRVADADVLADLLLAPLSPEVFLHQQGRGVRVERVIESLDHLALGVFAPRT